MASGSRGRTKKGSSRMDGAIEHLSLCGFSKKDITTTVNSLFKEYGGNDCWLFLESGGYQVIVEKILENQEGKKDDELVIVPANVSSVVSPQHNNSQPNVNQQEEQGVDYGESEIDKETRKKMKMDYLNKDFSDIPVVSEEMLNIIPPGRSRPPCFGYLSGTDFESDSGSDDDDDDDDEISH